MVRAMQRGGFALVLLGCCAFNASAASFSWRTYARKADDWYRGADATRIAANVLSYQSDHGDWPKNIDTGASPYEGDRAKLRGTFDNGATCGEMRFLARAYRVTRTERYREAFLKALDHVLAAQYPTGGWPQSYPPGKGYPRYITFNDDTMVNILELLRDVSRAEDFAFVDQERRDSAARAFDSGIQCILRCQVKVDGSLTVWCAQHDEVTFEPRPARTFEPASLSGGESSGILVLLMSLDRPSPEITRAIEAGARWFDSVKLTGIRQTVVNGDKVIVRDPGAPPLWARFYDLKTNRPLFCGRDGVIKFDFAEIEPERRNGYAWYGTWGRRVADRYTEWKGRQALQDR